MFIKFIITLSIVIGCVGCSNSTTNDAGNNTTVIGDLTGRVTLADNHGLPMTDKSGVLVQCEGTSYSAVTDTGGVWTIHNLPSRTYSLTFSKPGFFTWRDRSYSFLGGGVVRYSFDYIYNSTLYSGVVVTIVGIPEYTIQLDGLLLPIYTYIDSQLTQMTSGSIYGHSSMNTPSGTPLGVYFISSRSPSLSLDDPSSYVNTYSSLEDNGTVKFTNSPATHDTAANLTITNFPKLLNGFLPGDKIYVRAYPSFNSGWFFYYDDIEDRLIPVHSNNGSNILSAIVQ